MFIVIVPFFSFFLTWGQICIGISVGFFCKTLRRLASSVSCLKQICGVICYENDWLGVFFWPNSLSPLSNDGSKLICR